MNIFTALMIGLATTATTIHTIHFIRELAKNRRARINKEYLTEIYVAALLGTYNGPPDPDNPKFAKDSKRDTRIRIRAVLSHYFKDGDITLKNPSLSDVRRLLSEDYGRRWGCINPPAEFDYFRGPVYNDSWLPLAEIVPERVRWHEEHPDAPLFKASFSDDPAALVVFVNLMDRALEAARTEGKKKFLQEFVVAKPEARNDEVPRSAM